MRYLENDYEDMIDEVLSNTFERAKAKAMQLWNSGAVNTTPGAHDHAPYLPIQAIVIVAIEDSMPTLRNSPKGKAMIRNLRKF